MKAQEEKFSGVFQILSGKFLVSFRLFPGKFRDIPGYSDIIPGSFRVDSGHELVGVEGVGNFFRVLARKICVF